MQGIGQVARKKEKRKNERKKRYQRSYEGLGIEYAPYPSSQSWLVPIVVATKSFFTQRVLEKHEASTLNPADGASSSNQ